jgi:hypothetical protein
LQVIIAVWAFCRASIQQSRLAALAMAQVHTVSSWTFSSDSLSKSSPEKLPSHDIPLQVHSEHLEEPSENRQGTRTRAHAQGVQATMAAQLLSATRFASSCRRRVDTDLETRHVGIMKERWRTCCNGSS